MDKKVYALGFFDAVHKGHRAILEEGKSLAKKLGAELSVVTFDDELCMHFGKKSKELYLLKERKQIFESLGINDIVVLPGNDSFLCKSKEEFLDYLNDLHPAAFVAGRDYRFGRNAEGDVDCLTRYFADKNVAVLICELMTHKDKKISTTDIKAMLTRGEIEEANYLLDAPFFFYGEVVGGLQNGRKLGLPTANINFESKKLIPKSGVYMTKTVVDGQKYLSVTNIGEHPTINTQKANLETHLLDFAGDIYKKQIKIEFYKYIREIKKFNSAEELRAQINIDIEKTKETLLL